MDAKTINYLNNINRNFYATVADDFDQTRATAWPGWQRLLPYLSMPLSVLDVGCGNARFARFLHDDLILANYDYAPIASRSYTDAVLNRQRSAQAAHAIPGTRGSILLSYHGI